jgi:hypothetical protein
MKKIIREILNDLKSRPAQGTLEDSADLGAPKIFEPSTDGFANREPKAENQGEIAVTQSTPKPEDLGNTDFNSKPQQELPHDLNNQELSSDPLERTRQLEFQAQRSKERQTIG